MRSNDDERSQSPIEYARVPFIFRSPVVTRRRLFHLLDFIEFVADPMFTLWTRFVGSTFAKNLCRHLDNNKASWDDIAEEMSTTSSEAEDDLAESSAGSADC